MACGLFLCQHTFIPVYPLERRNGLKKSVIFLFAAILLCLLGYFSYQIGASHPANPPRPPRAPSAPPPLTLAATTLSNFSPNKLALRLGIIPERDVFQQRKAYQLLGEYLQTKELGLPTQATVEILTASSYASALKDLEENKLDAAFVDRWWRHWRSSAPA